MNREMNILAIETTGPLASVALIDQEQNIEEITSLQKMSHLQNLVPMIRDLLEKCQLGMNDVTHIAVSEGPGSFTGIRIGMATAKALAQTLSLPVISVPTLLSFAYHQPEFDGLYCPILDARREQVYAGVYYRSQGELCVAVPDGAYEIEELLQRIDQFDPDHPRSLLFFGDGIPVYKNAVDAWKIRTDHISLNSDFTLTYAKEENRYQMARSVARLAYRQFQEGKVGEFYQLKPVYLRKAEAERRLLEKLQQVDQT